MELRFARSIADCIGENSFPIFRDGINRGGEVTGCASRFQKCCNVWLGMGVKTAGHGNRITHLYAGELTIVAIGNGAVTRARADSDVLARRLDLDFSILAIFGAIRRVVTEQILCT